MHYTSFKIFLRRCNFAEGTHMIEFQTATLIVQEAALAAQQTALKPSWK